MRALFVIFALAIGSASADPLLVYPRGTGSPGQTFAPVVLRAPLATSGTGCIASLTGSFGEAITCTRASSATVVVGSETTCTSNVCRVDANGLLVESAHTNRFLNSDAPATQTITFATGNQYAWVTGAGNIALAVGTATATGLPCTATAASPCSFNVTGAGTVVATYTATLTFVDIGDGTYKTSAVHTVGAPVARAADDPSTPMLLSSGDTRWCIDATVTDENARGYAAGAAGIALGGTYPAANSFLLFFLGSGQISFEVYDAAAAQRQALSNAVPAFASGQHRVVACNEGAGALGLYLDGVKQTSTGAGAGTGIITSMPATLRLGEAGVGATVLAGGLKSLGVSRSSDPVVF